MIASGVRYFCKGIVVCLTVSALVHPVYATISSCSANASPSVLTVSSTTELTFSIQNSGSSNNAVWVKITRASDKYTIASARTDGGWNASTTATYVTFTGDNLAPGETNQFYVTATTGSSVSQGDENWIVQMSDDSGGAGETDCSGSLGTSIEAASFSISGVGATSIAGTSATITWSSSAASDSLVAYGTTSSYGSTKTDSAMTTSHSVQLTGLSLSTTYHYKVTSVDATDTSASSSDTTFTTTSGPTATPSPTGSPTGTPQPTATPTPIPDKTAPKVLVVGVDFTKHYKDPPAISVEAFDATSVEKLEYSLVGGATWSPIPNVKELGKTTVSTSFTPLVSGDGAQILLVRATDKAGNKGLSTKNTLVIDRSPPAITLITNLTKSFVKASKLVGLVTDASEVRLIEYSVSDGKDWLPVEAVGSQNGDSRSFSFTPPLSEDGNYTVSIRATDEGGNTGISALFTLIIDRLPPRAGGSMITMKSFVVPPNVDGVFSLPQNTEATLTVSVIGGPTAVDLGVTLRGDSAPILTVPLAINTDTGLWSGTFTLDTPGIYTAATDAVDGAGNTQHRDIATVEVVTSGTVVGDGTLVPRAMVTLYSFDEKTKRFSVWDGSAYGMVNPQKTDTSGSYTLFIPPGKYYATVRASGYPLLQTDIFSLTKRAPMQVPLTLARARGITIGPWTIPLPDFRVTVFRDVAQIERAVTDAAGSESLLLEKDLPDFRLTVGDSEVTPLTLRGKDVRLTFLNTWSPVASEELGLLSKATKAGGYETLVVVPQESLTAVTTYMHRGGYELPFAVDHDGVLVSTFDYRTIPVHVWVNGSGKVKRVAYGVLPLESLIQ